MGPRLNIAEGDVSECHLVANRYASMGLWSNTMENLNWTA